MKPLKTGAGPRTVVLNGSSLTIGELVAVSRQDLPVDIGPESMEAIGRSRHLVDLWGRSGKVIYGVTTGFGEMVQWLIPPDCEKELQENLIRSHAANVGDAFPREVVRGVLLLRLNCLAKGHSGVRVETVKTLLGMLNEKVHPQIPELGSVGASGDLSPLAHAALVACGEWFAEYKGEVLPGSEALHRAGIRKLDLGYKEGLALINGTSVMSAVGALLIHDADTLIKTAEIASAIAAEVLHASTKPFDEIGHAVKPHPGQTASARNMRTLLAGSRLTRSQEEIERALEPSLNGSVTQAEAALQNAYTLRCIPQVMGAIRDAVEYARRAIEIEMNAASDNPLIFPEEADVFHGGNFHGQTVAIPLDALAIALTQVGVISERRLDRMLDKNHNEGLPPFLVPGPAGLFCGFAGAQYTATSLVAENRTLCTPASIQSIPSNGGNQDIVSMGLIAARKASRILKNAEYILALELLAACQAADVRGVENLSPAGQAAYESVREYVPTLKKDRVMSTDISKIAEIIRLRRIVTDVEEVTGPLS